MADLKRKVFDLLNPICRDMSQGVALRFQCRATIEQAITEGEIKHSDVLNEQRSFPTVQLAEKIQYNEQDPISIQNIVEIIFWIAVDSYIEEWMNSPT